MRIVHLTPGTGNFHCGSCIRDNALIKALQERGHEAIMLPLYLPLVTDDGPASPHLKVQAGGINLYIHEQFPKIARFFPALISRALDHPACLRAASHLAAMTSPKDLGRMTLSSLQGGRGKQGRQWQNVIDWIARTQGPTEIVSLSNSLIAGLVPMIHQTLACPVLVSLQGEDAFLDTLPEPFKGECWKLLAELARQSDSLIAPSLFYATHMAKRLGIDEGEISIISNGEDWKAFTPSSASLKRQPATIGFLGRMIEGKGLGNLVDAFLTLRSRDSIPHLRLHLAGATTHSDTAYLAELRKRIATAGATEDVTWSPNIDLQEKANFFHSITVFSMPAPSSYREAFGLPIIEAMACGSPVVQPDSGAYPEIIKQTGGGLIYPADDAGALADQLERVLNDPELRDQLSEQGGRATRALFTATRAAEAFENVAARCLTAFHP